MTECRCTMVAAQTFAEPAEWEQAADCPVHPLAIPPRANGGRSVSAWARRNGIGGLDRRQLRRLRRRTEMLYRANICDDCGGSLTHIAGPGDFRAIWCSVCDRDSYGAWLDDQWLDHMEATHMTDTPDGL